MAEQEKGARNYAVRLSMPMLGTMLYLLVAGQSPELPVPRPEQTYMRPVAEHTLKQDKPNDIKPKRPLKYAALRKNPVPQVVEKPASTNLDEKLFGSQQWLKDAVMRKIDDIVSAESLRKQGKNQVSIADLSNLFSNGTRYRDYIEPMSRRTGIPMSVISALTARESSSDHLAYGPTHDAGLWQISPKTGKSLGLIEKDADYRFDPKRSTEAIEKMLQELKGRYGNRWHLIVNAYNHGGSRLDKDIKTRTPMKSHVRDHTITIMAYAYLYEMKDKYGIKIQEKPLYSVALQNARDVPVGRKPLNYIVKKYNVSEEMICYLNPATLNPLLGYVTKQKVRLPM